MSDIRTEMTKVMNQWDSNSNGTVTTEMSLGNKIFEYIKTHPNSTMAQIQTALKTNKSQSVGSQIKTLVDRGLLGRNEVPVPHYRGFGRRTQWEYFVLTNEYKTVNKDYWRPKDAKPKKEVRIREAMYRPPVPRITAPLERRLEEPAIFSAAEFIEKLSVTQAKAVYLALEKVFNG